MAEALEKAMGAVEKPKLKDQLWWLIKTAAIAKAAEKGDKEALKSLASIATATRVNDLTNAEHDRLKKARIARRKAKEAKVKAKEAKKAKALADYLHPAFAMGFPQQQ